VIGAVGPLFGRYRRCDRDMRVDPVLRLRTARLAGSTPDADLCDFSPSGGYAPPVASIERWAVCPGVAPGRRGGVEPVNPSGRLPLPSATADFLPESAI